MEDAKLFRQYTVIKQQIADLIRVTRQTFEAEKAENWADQCRALQVKLAADRFNLVVLGQFKRGKSSLINAIIGKDLLPTGLLPLTSAITTLRYGPQEKVYLRRKDWVLEQEISISDLPDFVTEQGNPGNEKGLIEARVELPVPFLRRGVHFVDTPGVGSARIENTTTTYQFLPEADAVIFVTSVEAPLSQAEQDFLRVVSVHVRKLFVVVNKVDLVSSPEREQVLDYIRANVAIILGTNEISFFPMSARQALTDKTVSGKEESGVEHLEAALETFLVHEKSRAFFVSILDRLIQILASTISEENEPSLTTGQLDALWIAATNLRTGLLEGEQSLFSTLKEMNIIASPKKEELRKQDIQSSKKQDLPRTRTCPICSALRQELFDYFVNLQQVGAEELQEFLTSGGLCQVHAWQFRDTATTATINQMYAPLVESIAARLKQMRDDPQQNKGRNNQLTSGQGICPACALMDKVERAQIEKFLEYIRTSEGKSYYRNALGLCLPHLEITLAVNTADDIRDLLLQEQSRHLEELSEDMRNYVLKREALRRDLLNTNEENASSRALVQMVGERMSFIMPRNGSSHGTH
jgi:GTP-binding protein EngB required for normal cell division